MPVYLDMSNTPKPSTEKHYGEFNCSNQPTQLREEPKFSKYKKTNWATFKAFVGTKTKVKTNDN